MLSSYHKVFKVRQKSESPSTVGSLHEFVSVSLSGQVSGQDFSILLRASLRRLAKTYSSRSQSTYSNARGGFGTTFSSTKPDMAQMQPPSHPTSLDQRSHRPAKKARPNPQGDAVAALFSKQPDIQIPESATRGPRTSSSLAPPPEIVANVQGSSAGAGSGEFHVYKASRRREYERIRVMEEEAKREEEQKEWEEKRNMNKQAEEAKANKNRKRRERQKAGKNQKQMKDHQSGGDEAEGGGHRVKLKPMQIRKDEESDQDEAGKAGDGGNGSLEQEESGIVVHDDD